MPEKGVFPYLPRFDCRPIPLNRRHALPLVKTVWEQRPPATGKIGTYHVFLENSYFEILTHLLRRHWWNPQYISDASIHRPTVVIQLRQCHCLPICFLTSNLTNQKKTQRTLIVRQAGLSFFAWLLGPSPHDLLSFDASVHVVLTDVFLIISCIL